ncbi:hypothetical protein PsorP6_010522 [Peronosclerospora sorghi]|uniref:Uncharacterized protein n=1 Tax=Peronosclerospora sorghi TaxID=230839 RepID=A0ACC0VYG9_9STRA|nr:hypothetical protein PsorP6_010522 [Peronosclerospora sorghi]
MDEIEKNKALAHQIREAAVKKAEESGRPRAGRNAFWRLADFCANEKIALRHFYAEKFTCHKVTVCPATVAQILKNLVQKKTTLYSLSGWGECDRYHYHDPPKSPKLDYAVHCLGVHTGSRHRSGGTKFEFANLVVNGGTKDALMIYGKDVHRFHARLGYIFNAHKSKYTCRVF